MKTSSWILIALAVLLAVGMLLTLWAGKEGKVRSRHGVVGKAGGGASPGLETTGRS